MKIINKIIILALFVMLSANSGCYNEDEQQDSFYF
jgi:hypothetical protein